MNEFIALCRLRSNTARRPAPS